ncbi:MAG TPA: NfeD family protein [Thermoanaerobaculia bacterium]|nr:NfeD family protein [Thermoanaerobaculia bacterium]
MGDPFGGGSLLALGAIALLAVFIVLRFASLAAELAIFIERLVKGRPAFYGEGRAEGAPASRYGRSRTELAPRGKVFVAGELWEAESDRRVPAGSRVEITGRDGLVLRVRPAGPDDTGQKRSRGG